MKFPASDLFLDIAKIFSINDEIVQKTANNLDLFFSDENESHGNVCFANSPDLRPDFKETFTSLDLQNCIYAILHSSEYKDNDAKIPTVNQLRDLLPTDRITFWNFAEQGRELHQQKNRQK